MDIKQELRPTLQSCYNESNFFESGQIKMYIILISDIFTLFFL